MLEQQFQLQKAVNHHELLEHLQSYKNLLTDNLSQIPTDQHSDLSTIWSHMVRETIVSIELLSRSNITPLEYRKELKILRRLLTHEFRLFEDLLDRTNSKNKTPPQQQRGHME